VAAAGTGKIAWGWSGSEIASVDNEIVRFQGRLDFLSAAGAKQQLTEAVRSGRRRLVVDLAGVTFLDSSGLGALIAGLKAARQAGGDLRIAQAGDQAMTVLKLTSLDRVFRIYPTVEEASADD
jgi:anti-sigma B factor antagonist